VNEDRDAEIDRCGRKKEKKEIEKQVTNAETGTVMDQAAYGGATRHRHMTQPAPSAGHPGSHDGGSELHEASANFRPSTSGGVAPPPRGLLARDEYKRHAYASNHALFTGRVRKSNTAVVNRQRKWGFFITSGTLLFVYLASYGLGQRDDGRRGMHSDGKFTAPVGYSTKGLDFRRAYLERENANARIMHQMHAEAAVKVAAGETKSAGPDAHGAQATSSSTIQVKTPDGHGGVGADEKPAVSFIKKFSHEESAGGVPLPPLIGYSGGPGSAPSKHGVAGGAKGGFMSGFGSWPSWRELSSSSAYADVKAQPGGLAAAAKPGPGSDAEAWEADASLAPAGDAGAATALQVARGQQLGHAGAATAAGKGGPGQTHPAQDSRPLGRLPARAGSAAAAAGAVQSNIARSGAALVKSERAGGGTGGAGEAGEGQHELAKRGQDWVAREVASEMHKADLVVAGRAPDGSLRVVGGGARGGAASSLGLPAEGADRRGKAREDNVEGVGEAGASKGEAAAAAAAADPAAQRVRARTDGVEVDPWQAVVHPPLDNFIIGDASIEQETKENAATDRDLPRLPTLGPKAAVEEGPPPLVSAAPSAGDVAARAARADEAEAKAAVGGHLFSPDLFKALKPFPEPAIDPP